MTHEEKMKAFDLKVNEVFAQGNCVMGHHSAREVCDWIEWKLDRKIREHDVKISVDRRFNFERHITILTRDLPHLVVITDDTTFTERMLHRVFGEDIKQGLKIWITFLICFWIVAEDWRPVSDFIRFYLESFKSIIGIE